MNYSSKWVSIAVSLSEDINAKIKCPVCDVEYIIFDDVPFDEDDLTRGGER